MEADPVAIDLNVDAALLLKDLVGIDSYPPVLALLPNIYNLEDRDRVRAVVAEQLAEAGILVDDRVHPAVAQWLRCLDRPDVELVVRIVETGAGGETPGMLRMSLVRTGESHVLALRNDDYVVIQPVFHEGRQLNTVAAGRVAAVGQFPARKRVCSQQRAVRPGCRVLRGTRRHPGNDRGVSRLTPAGRSH
ncbi:ESX secretion-associated protein EspG, partial [Nocardia cyriacigeorgica]|uniref:ESX secretion-associated protein EspG n=1 Tax=Nocardia cyriacigeorgica TaxID=135487 RepID=UPI002458883E